MALADYAIDQPLEDDDVDVAPAEPDANVATTEEAIDKLRRWADPMATVNIAEELEPGELADIGMRVIRETEIDEQSRSEWLDRNEAAMKLANQVAERKQYPWEGASYVIWPMLTEAANQFAARAYGAVVMDRNVVKAERESGDKVTRAEPVAAQAEAGNLDMLETDWNETFLDEATTFPASKFKD